ncbi:MAG: hypothetical protein HOH74_15180, partial [Gemmatimonadetes bacterium]|nr:hypothetical protein [Gemmatimonadota bacterium]
MTSLEGVRLVVACVVPVMVIPVRHWMSGGDAGRHRWLEVMLAPSKLAAIAGVAVGWGAPDWIREGLTPVAMSGFVFLSGWVGLACGSSLDLRVSRRLNRTTATSDLGQALLAVGVVSLLVWATRFMPPEWVSFGPLHVLTLAAVCLLGPVLPARQRQRGAAGGGSGFWEPTLKSPLALLLAAGAVTIGSMPTIQLQLPPPLSHALTMEMGGPVSQLLWATVGGAIAGLLMDLVSREDFAPGGLYVQMAAVTLVCSGLSAMMGLSPLWIGT